jgi:hypothetical protein
VASGRGAADGGRFKAAHGGAELAPLVGRNESKLLESRWKQACGGEGQAVLVGGQPSIGKSRLIEGLREGITEPHSVPTTSVRPIISTPPCALSSTSSSWRALPRRFPEQRLEKLEAFVGNRGHWPMLHRCCAAARYPPGAMHRGSSRRGSEGKDA